ncbi:creatininase family protein [Marinivivus vitaminiproducens]|uniref:creatininase family protein n=1 Tax=Marinivivus vitaminiproducens TaxID=3035935 RepID=UPI00279A7A85|nr:creatininase family protein [Geminicoccaceae bacterium SCSIO 64248]
MVEVEWGRLRAHELRALAEREAVVIVPVGSLEQHGPHLPTFTDTLLVSEVAIRAARLAYERQPVLVTPCVWTGLSEHHMIFGGTVTLDYATFAALLRGIVGSLVQHGFERICLLNGHGGNVAALRTITEELTLEFDVPIVSGTYWHIAGERVNALLETQDTIRHACEAETSMVMALAPERVDRDKLADADHDDDNARSPSDPLYRWSDFAERTPTGALGTPSAATPEKGERLLAEAAAVLADRLADAGLWTTD